MTKRVRIENADTSDRVVAVRAENYNPVLDEWVSANLDGQPNDQPILLSFPAQQTEQLIYDGRRIIIDEIGTNGYTFTPKKP